jgi:hypothetical protein
MAQIILIRTKEKKEKRTEEEKQWSKRKLTTVNYKQTSIDTRIISQKKSGSFPPHVDVSYLTRSM